jgi:Fe-S-cluster containining protein
MCCGPVAITPARLEVIRDYLLTTMPRHEKRRLAMQQRHKLDCGFLDKETHRCTIYPARPWVCEAFGRTEGLECPKVGHLVQILPILLVDTKRDEEIKAGVAGMSNLWNWKKMEFERG